MGRELRRVSMDFTWPLDKVWEGYLNPHFKACTKCENGSTQAMHWLKSIVSLIMIAGEDGRKGRLHPYLRNLENRPNEQSPSMQMSELSCGLAGREPSFLGHDACDRWAATKKIIAAAGLPEDWGICPSCKGDGVDESCKEAYESWKQIEPPIGDGYQLWETCSEGSPITPVFASLEELCAWAENNASTFGSAKTSAVEWRRMLTDGLVVHQEGNVLFL